MYPIQADETHAAATESLCGNAVHSIKSQYCVGGQNRFTKSFMGELPLLDQSPTSPPLPFSVCSQPASFFPLPYGEPPSVLSTWRRFSQSMMSPPGLNGLFFRGGGLIMRGVEHMKDLSECISVCVLGVREDHLLINFDNAVIWS